jgi:hypothetical protein
LDVSQTAAAATATTSTVNGTKLQVEAWRRDIAATTATGADKTTANFFQAGAVFLARLGAVFLLLVDPNAIVDSSEVVGAHPSTCRSWRTAKDAPCRTTRAHNDDGPP